MKYSICSACETVQHCSKNGCIPMTDREPRAADPTTATQIHNQAIRDAMAAIAATESRKQALEIMKGLIKP